MINCATALGAMAVIVGFTAQNVTIVYWLESSVSAYAVLLLCGVCFSLLFFTSSLVFALRTGDWSVFQVSDDKGESRLFISPVRGGKVRLSHAQTLAAAGLCNALNGILIVYASSSTRTPPVIQAILQNCGVLFSVPFSKLVLGDVKRYLAWEPLRAAGIVVASVGVSLAPTLAALASGKESATGFNGTTTLAWVLVYTAGLAPNALLNILQQLYFIRTGSLRPEATPHEQLRGTLRALMFSNFMQPLAYLALFWVDILPWFGSSKSATDFLDVTLYSMGCSVGGAKWAGSMAGRTCSPLAPLWAWSFILAYTLAYFGGAQLNRESATFNMLCLVVVTASTALLWLIPGVNPNPESTPAWSVIVSLILALVGSVLWKVWEGRSPPEVQFPTLRADGEGYEGMDEMLLMGRAIAGNRGATFDGAASEGGWSSRRESARGGGRDDSSEYEGEGGERETLSFLSPTR